MTGWGECRCGGLSWQSYTGIEYCDGCDLPVSACQCEPDDTPRIVTIEPTGGVL